MLLLLAAPIMWLGMHSLAALEPVRRWTAIALRLVVLTLLVMMLAGLQGVKIHSDLTVMVVKDTSESVRRFAQPPAGSSASSIDEWFSDWVAAASSGKRQTDRLGVVTYDRRPTVRIMPTAIDELDPGISANPQDGTDTASALRAAMAVLPADTAARILIASDFNETNDDLQAAALEARAAGIIVDVLPLEYQLDREVMVEALHAPTDAREGQTAGLRVVLRATYPTTGLLHLIHDDEPVGRGYPIRKKDWSLEEEAATASPSRYIAVKQLDLPLTFSGVNRFQAIFEADDEAAGDTITKNNRADAFTLVAGEGRVLVVNYFPGNRESGMVLPHALESRGIKVDVVDPMAMPARITQLQRYDAVIFQNVPADEITAPQQRMLARYVNDMGGGFIMIGGPESFAAGGWTNSPIDDILPVECQIPSQTILPSGALVLVIDRSGSMNSTVGGTNRTQQVVANEAAVLALSTLYPQDLVGVVVFDGSAKWIVKLQSNGDAAGVAKLVRSVTPQGGTNIYAGLEEAYNALAPVRTADAAVRHMILLTDGNSMPPPGGSYIKLVAKMMKADITLSTIGVGDGHDGTLLNQLAQMGGGTYHPIRNPNNLPQIFIKEAKTIRKNLIKETPFIPQLRTTGSPIMANITAVPALQGLVLTGPKHDPRVFMPILGPEGEPVFAHWQAGLGRSAAFTSDATNRWGVDWLSWDGYADFWARTVRTIARPTQSRSVDLLADIQGDTLNIRLDTAAEETASKFAKVVGSVLKPDGKTTEISLEQVGPGLYQTDLSAEQSGNYIVSLFLIKSDGTRQAVFTGVSRAPGAELRRFQSNLPLAQRIANITGGTVHAANQPHQVNLFTRDHGFITRSIRPLWRTLLIWLLTLVLLDVACRRIAWDPAAIAAWCRQNWQRLFASRKVEGTATLTALKARSAKTREKTAAASADDLPVRTRKFEANADFVASDNIAEAVGGANQDTQPKKPVIREASEPDTDDGSTTSRLLAAKQRTRDRIDES